jgi:hypothetical protein
MKAFCILTLSISLVSCWPKSISFVDKNMPEEWKTFSVKTFENNAANTPLSYAANFSEKVKDAVQSNTRLLLNPTTGQGEVLIEGVISNYSVAPIAIQPGDNSEKNRLSISISYTVYISKPKEDEIKFTATRFIDYDSNTDLASVESVLLDEVNTQLIQDLINKLMSNW